MIYSDGYSEVEISLKDKMEEIGDRDIGIGLSGGCDSALVLYMICKEILDNDLDVAIQPSCTRDIPNIHLISMAIVDEYRRMFPTVNIKDLHYYPEFIDKQLTLNEKKTYSKERMELLNVGLYFTGITKTPPKKVMKDIFPYEVNDRLSDDEVGPNILKLSSRFNNYQPLVNVDKKFVANMYRQLNLMDNIYPLTRSCVGLPEVTDFYTKPCKKCWWCIEKKWAFGTYDLDG